MVRVPGQDVVTPGPVDAEPDASGLGPTTAPALEVAPLAAAEDAVPDGLADGDGDGVELWLADGLGLALP